MLVDGCCGNCQGRGKRERESNAHLGIKDTSRCLNDADSLIVDLHRVERILVILQHSRDIELQVLRMQLRREGVRQGLALASWNLDVVPLHGQVADDLRPCSIETRHCHQRAADEGHGHGLRLFIGEGEDGAGGVAVDQLDAEDFSLGEGGRDFDFEVRRGGGVFDFLFELFDGGLDTCELNASLQVWGNDASWQFGALHLFEPRQ